MFIDFLYMFWATVCPSSEENTVPMRHLAFVTLYRVLQEERTRLRESVP